MKLPILKSLAESLVDRDNLVQALQKGDKKAAMDAISSAMKNKKSYNTPAQEFDLEDSQYKQVVNLVRQGDMEKAASIIGASGEYPERGIGADMPKQDRDSAKPGEELQKHLEVYKKIVYSGRPKDAEVDSEFGEASVIFYGIDEKVVSSKMNALGKPYKRYHPGTVDVEIMTDPLVEEEGLLALWIPQRKNRVWSDVHIIVHAVERGKEDEVEQLLRKVFKEYVS